MPESLPPNEASESPKVEAPAPRAIRQIESLRSHIRGLSTRTRSPGWSAADWEMPACSSAADLPKNTAGRCNSRTPLSRSDWGRSGEHFEDCQGRFGEFIAAGGAVAYLPTDGTNVQIFC